MYARLLVPMLVFCHGALASEYRTENFIVTTEIPAAPPAAASEVHAYQLLPPLPLAADPPEDALEASEEQVEAIARTAERCRKQLAVRWLGRELPRWETPCLITVALGPKASAFSRFRFPGGVASDFEMTVNGPIEQILENIIPHELIHLLFATHYGRSMVRWWDEGIAMSCESDAERRRLKQFCIESADDGYWIALHELLERKEYPAGERNRVQFYWQSAAFTGFLLERGSSLAPCTVKDRARYSRRKLIELERIATREKSWEAAFRIYRFKKLEEVEAEFLRYLGIKQMKKWI